MAPEHAGFAAEMAKLIGRHPVINGVLLAWVRADVTRVTVWVRILAWSAWAQGL